MSFRAVAALRNVSVAKISTSIVVAVGGDDDDIVGVMILFVVDL
jgi:hypothetical protein